jgi:hypothetical protein
MTAETEAAADVLTGAVVASALEPRGGPAVARPPDDDAHAVCFNCGAALTDAYCARCGQRAHLHRSIASLAHDILHSVFHFEGRFFRTLPELAIHPGRLTRRYIDGERAKFISPMALYLFSVFLMYAVFSFTGGPAIDQGFDRIPGYLDGSAVDETVIESVRQQVEIVEGQLSRTDLSAEQRSNFERQLAELETSRDILEAVAAGDSERVEAIASESAADRNATEEPTDASSIFDARVTQALQELKDNPRLVAYRVKTNGYKYSWALVPLSIPFMWLLFFWRRDVRVYDHAVFVTYSISFMLLWLIVTSLLRLAWPGSGVIAPILQIVPLIHIYRQLRGTYGLSRRGALLRLFFVLVAATIVLIIFVGLLLILGMLG